MLAVLLMISSCDLMDGTKRSFESVAVEDVIANSHLDQAVEYSYVAEGHERHKLDFYKYSGDPEVKRPTLLWIHGGAWVAGDKRSIDPIAYQIAGLGKYNLVSINYRLANDETAPWPEIVYDVNAAIRWVKLNSDKLGIDPNKLVLAGESAVAHLAAMSAFSHIIVELIGDTNLCVSTAVRHLVSFYGAHILQRVV